MTRFYPVQFHEKSQVVLMAQFINRVLNGRGAIPIGMQTKVTSLDEGAFPFAKTQMGLLRLFQIPIKVFSNITALDQFSSPPIRISGLDITAGHVSSLRIQLHFVIENPSFLSIKLGALVLDVYYQNTWLGTAKISNFSLRCCRVPTLLNGTFIFEPVFPADFIPRSFLSNFVSGYFTNGKAQEVIDFSDSIIYSPLKLCFVDFDTGLIIKFRLGAIKASTFFIAHAYKTRDIRKLLPTRPYFGFLVDDLLGSLTTISSRHLTGAA